MILAVAVVLAARPWPVRAAVDAGDLRACDATTPTELEDLETIAEQKGIAMDEAVARYGWQECFSEIATALADAYPEDYAGAAITDGGRGAWIAFSDEVPDDAAQAVEAVPVTVQLIGGRGFAEAELDQVLQTVYEHISRHPDVLDAAGSADIETGVVTVDAAVGEAAADPAQRARLRQALAPDQPANPAITVEVRLMDELAAGLDAASQSRWRRVLAPVGYAIVLAVAVLALAAGLLSRRRRSR